MERSGAAVPWGTYASYSSLAAPTGFEPVPHGVTSRHCSHSTMEPKSGWNQRPSVHRDLVVDFRQSLPRHQERVGVIETPSSLWKSDIMSRYTKPAYKKPHLRRINGPTAISEVGVVLLIQDLVGWVGIEPHIFGFSDRRELTACAITPL